MAATQKLGLEVQLFQIKLLLLSDDVSRDIKTRCCSTGLLEELRQHMVLLQRGEISAVQTQNLSRRLKQILADLARESAAERQGRGGKQ